MRVIEANRRPSILARVLGSMLRTVREIAGLSYEEAAARLGCEADWLVRVETGFAVAGPEEVARILVEYGVREAKVNIVWDPPWDPSRMSDEARTVLNMW